VPTSIAVLGAIVYDEIITHDGGRIESYGGIIYNLAALSSLVGDKVDIYPISHVGADRYDAVMDLVSGMRGVRTDGLRKWDGKLTHAQLVYRGVNYRDEYVRHMMKPYTIEDLESVLSCDAMLVNFVNGTEIDLTTLREVRMRTDAIMYLDMHNIMVRFAEDGQKTFPDFENWAEWVEVFDIVQLNEFECEKVLKVTPSDSGEFLDAAQYVLRMGSKVALVTMGPEGVALAHRQDDRDYGCIIPSGPVGTFVDATGCGDAFSAGMLWNYLQTGSPVTAALAGSLIGALNCEVSGIGSLDKARDAASRLNEVSPEVAGRVADGWLGYRLD
jgi:sugar/nucleoside kinase (ribokinase family)